jgi:hypothetical protein
MKLNKIIIPVLLLLGAFSCTNSEPINRQLHSFEAETVLVIPPVCKESKVSELLGRSLTTSLIKEVATDVRYAGDIPKLKSILSKDNLMSDGQIDMAEISRVGKAINAQEVICVRVTALSTYPPQSMSALVIVRSIEGDKYKQRVSYVNINMNDPGHQKEMAEFSRGSLRGPVGDRFVTKKDVNLEAALLSNDEFSKFAGYKIAKSILYMKKY